MCTHIHSDETNSSCLLLCLIQVCTLIFALPVNIFNVDRYLLGDFTVH